MRLTAMVALVVAIAAIGGCGGGDKTDSAKTNVDAEKPNVDIRDFKFKSPLIDVKLGDTVIWTNFDRAPHTATTTEGSAFQFDTGTLRRGQAKRIKFTSKGTFSYICSFHPFMEGKVEVK